tara:strand:+ start:272 stop:850 length:579 start_codon:yes stop_codon:yes gene_type:complete
MPITFNGNGTVTGLAVGGLPDGTVDADTLASGVGGKVLQVKQTVKKDTFSATVAANAASGDITGLNVSITPTNASNKILLFPQVSVGEFASLMYFYKDGSLITDAIADASGSLQRATFGSSNSSTTMNLNFGGAYLDTAGGTSAITYSIRIGSARDSSQTFYINRVWDTDESYSGRSIARYISTFTVMEVAA